MYIITFEDVDGHVRVVAFDYPEMLRCLQTLKDCDKPLVSVAECPMLIGEEALDAYFHGAFKSLN